MRFARIWYLRLPTTTSNSAFPNSCHPPCNSHRPLSRFSPSWSVLRSRRLNQPLPTFYTGLWHLLNPQLSLAFPTTQHRWSQTCYLIRPLQWPVANLRAQKTRLVTSFVLVYTHQLRVNPNTGLARSPCCPPSQVAGIRNRLSNFISALLNRSTMSLWDCHHRLQIRPRRKQIRTLSWYQPRQVHVHISTGPLWWILMGKVPRSPSRRHSSKSEYKNAFSTVFLDSQTDRLCAGIGGSSSSSRFWQCLVAERVNNKHHRT